MLNPFYVLKSIHTWHKTLRYRKSKSDAEILLENFINDLSWYLFDDVEVIVWIASTYKKRIIYKIPSIDYVGVLYYDIADMTDRNHMDYYYYEQTFTPLKCFHIWCKVVEICPKHNIKATFLNDNEIKFCFNFNTLKNFPHCT